MSEQVSVIIPAYNTEKYLAEAIQSVLDQAYEPLEVLVVDDGSHDGTSQAAKAFGERVRTFWQPNSGVGSARNFGLQHAGGSLFAFLDADDLWTSDKLALQLQALRDNPALEAVFGHVQNFLEPGPPGQARIWQEKLPGYVAGTMLIRRQAMERIQGFSTQFWLGETIDFYFRVLEQSLQVQMLPDVVLYRRIHGGNISLLHQKTKNDHLLRVLKARLDRKRGITDS